MDTHLTAGDQILLIKSTGINANGSSLVRALAKELPMGYASKLPNGKTFGEAVSAKSNIYSRLVRSLLNENIEIHYISNITGHGLRKIMRTRQNFTYILDAIIKPPELFCFIQEKAQMTDEEAYGTFNMGMDFSIFLPRKHVDKCLEIIKLCGFSGICAGHIQTGDKKAVIQPKKIFLKAKL